MGDEVIFAPAYAAALYAADKATGEIRWKLPVGNELLQQWSSPVQVDERRVLLARADGVLYQIDIAERKIEWALVAAGDAIRSAGGQPRRQAWAGAVRRRT